MQGDSPLTKREWFRLLKVIVTSYGGQDGFTLSREERFHDEDISGLLHELGHIACLPKPHWLRHQGKTEDNLLEVILNQLPTREVNLNECYAEVVASRLVAGFGIPIKHSPRPFENDYSSGVRKYRTLARKLASSNFRSMPAACREGVFNAFELVRQNSFKVYLSKRLWRVVDYDVLQRDDSSHLTLKVHPKTLAKTRELVNRIHKTTLFPGPSEPRYATEGTHNDWDRFRDRSRWKPERK